MFVEIASNLRRVWLKQSHFSQLCIAAVVWGVVSFRRNFCMKMDCAVVQATILLIGQRIKARRYELCGWPIWVQAPGWQLHNDWIPQKETTWSNLFVEFFGEGSCLVELSCKIWCSFDAWLRKKKCTGYPICVSNCQFGGVLFQSPPNFGGKDGEKPTESMWGIGSESTLGNWWCNMRHDTWKMTHIMTLWTYVRFILRVKVNY